MQTEFQVSSNQAPLGFVRQEVGESIQYAISYRLWLAKGEVLEAVTFTIDYGTATISNDVISPDHKSVSLLLTGGTLGTTFNVIAFATTSVGQEKYDSFSVEIITNGGLISAPGIMPNNLLSIVGSTGPFGPTGRPGVQPVLPAYKALLVWLRIPGQLDPLGSRAIQDPPVR